jgi:S-formylglutathione hydrolase FrmB
LLTKLVEALATPDTIDYAASPFGAKNLKVSVGNTYTIKAIVDEDGKLNTIWGGTAKWKPNAERWEGYRDAWQANDRAVALSRRAKAAQASAAKNGRLDQLLGDLSRIYQQVSPANREAFKLMVLMSLKDPPSLAQRRLKQQVDDLRRLNAKASKELDKMKGKANAR